MNAADALNTLAEQTDTLLLFPYLDAQSRQTNAISGRFELTEALAIMLEGSGLQGGLSENGAIKISRLENERQIDETKGNESMITKKGLFATVLGFLASVGASDLATAQGSSVTSIEEVIVTARRREENLQEVPIAITAISAEQLELRSIENVEDLQVLLPNVDISGQGRQGGAGGNFTVRGVGGVARYIDGVALTGNQGSLANVVELERIEVLRGPQGTYFGKNAIGGAIQYITKKPADEFGARIKLTGGSFDRQDIVINVDIPLSDTVKTKLTAASLYRGGYVDSVTIHKSYGEQNNDIVSGALEWTPTDNFTALFTATKNTEASDMQAYVLFDVVENFPGPDTPGKYNLAGIPFTDALYAYGQREEYKTAADYQGPGVDFESTSLSATLTWDINEDISLRSITGTRDLHSGVWQDTDATPLGFFNTWSYSEISEISQEFQLYGGTDRLDWIVGTYYQSAENVGVGTNFQGMELAPALQRIRNTLGTSDTTDTAIFAEVVYQFTDQLSLTVGARQSKEKVENASYAPTRVVTMADMNTPIYSTAGTLRTFPDGSDLITKGDFDAFTHRLAVQYQVNDDIMVYAGQAQGFNGGGINNTYNVALPQNGIFPYTSEKLTSNELGFRSDLMDNMLRLNATYFWGDWDDIQVGETLVPGVMTTNNAGAAKISGVEVEGTWNVNDEISVDFTIGRLKTEYTDIGASVTAIAVGTTFPFSPERSYSIGGQWAKGISNGGRVVSRLDYGHISDFETFTETAFQVAQGPNNPYGLLSGRITYTPPSDNYTLAFFGTNLTNQWYRLGGFAAVLAGVDQGVVARPREIGVSLTMDF